MNEKDALSRIREMCTSGGDLIPLSVLCNSVGSIGLREPIVVDASASLRVCVDLLANHKTGSLIITDHEERVIGIFTDRDCVTKVVGRVSDLETATISDFMTGDPACERPETTIAFALNVMSHGGFRNLPIIDEAGRAIGILSVKDIVDYLVGLMLESIETAIEGKVGFSDELENPG